MRNRHSAHDTEGAKSAFRNGSDRGSVQVCLSGCFALHRNSVSANARSAGTKYLK